MSDVHTILTNPGTYWQDRRAERKRIKLLIESSDQSKPKTTKEVKNNIGGG